MWRRLRKRTGPIRSRSGSVRTGSKNHLEMFTQKIDVEELCLEDDAYNDVLRIAEHLPSLYIVHWILSRKTDR